MSREALLASLRARAAEDRAAVWADARAQADLRRAELARAVAAERERTRATLASLVSRLAEDARAERRRRRLELRTQATLRLERRCRELAQAELASLRDEQLFERLTRELPTLDWQRVEVNPADAAPARAAFPGATVVVDAAITGGMNVATRDDRVRVENSLETRLATAWPDLVPELVSSLLPETDDDGAAA